LKSGGEATGVTVHSAYIDSSTEAVRGWRAMLLAASASGKMVIPVGLAVMAEPVAPTWVLGVTEPFVKAYASTLVACTVPAFQPRRMSKRMLWRTFILIVLRARVNLEMVTDYRLIFLWTCVLCVHVMVRSFSRCTSI
jgi:hypothetical protein